MILNLISLIISFLIVLLFRFMNKSHISPTFGIYQQRNKNYWIKFIFMYIFLKLRQFLIHLKLIIVGGASSPIKGTVHVLDYQEKLEQLYNLGDYSQSIDGVYFNGMSDDEAIISGLARRPNGICDAFLYLKIKGEEDILLTPSLPDTYLQKTQDDGEGHNVRGINISNFIPMRAWKLQYNGEMKSGRNKKMVEAELTWSAMWSPFEYDSHMSAYSMASDMAREPWSRDYFNLIKKLHQTHYEQMGYIAGKIKVDDKTYDINMPCVRDRSYGNLREWRNFHRYVYHFVFLDNGDFMAVGSVSQPSILSHLTIGYVCTKADQNVVAVDNSDFKLYQHGENQIMPTDYGFVFEAGGKTYAVQVKVTHEESFYIGKKREAKFYERWSRVEVNGVKGRACVEWHYNNVIQK